jgi:hypothetical protein
MTEEDRKPYARGEKLLNLRKYFGPERRDIIMLWKNTDSVTFEGLDAREPKVTGSIATLLYRQHYGKSLSIEHWESTCNYYVKHFPYNPYGKNGVCDTVKQFTPNQILAMIFYRGVKNYSQML